jgi:UDP-N-acetyl-D-mannosaminuronic acid transferase (WecB/TagA/CpsF family)
MDWLFDLGISAVLSALKQAVKNPERKAAIRRAMLKVYTQIGIVFAADSDFAQAAENAHK